MEGHPMSVTPPFPGLPTEMVFKILDDLDDRSLFSCRLVSQGWCQASSTILQSRPTVIMTPSCSLAPWTRTESLADFIKCFKKFRKFHHLFPCVNFILLNALDKNSSKFPDLDSFFALSQPSTTPSNPNPNSGLLIKCLGFEYMYSCPVTMSTLKRLLFEFEVAPHLKILSLSFSRYGNEHVHQTKEYQENADESRPCNDLTLTWSDNEKFILPSLQVLQLDGLDCAGASGMEFVTNILKVAPNLQRIEGCIFIGFHSRRYRVFHPNDLQPLIDAKKLHLVKHCKIVLDENVAVLERFAREKLVGVQFQPTSLKLEHLAGIRRLEATKLCIRHLLWLVKDVVEELWTDGSLGLLNQGDVPQFSRLRWLHWNLNRGYGHWILPGGMRNRGIFPRLEKISLHLNDVKVRILPDLSHIPVSPSVQNLEIQALDRFRSSLWESMALMCPNVRNLDFYYSGGIRRVVPPIWNNFGGLRFLKLNPELIWKKLEKTEAVFTGFSLETVRQLQAQSPEDRPRAADVEHLRVNPSILQLTELQKLVIRQEDRLNVQPLPLSFKYAFDLMPRLTVDLGPT